MRFPTDFTWGVAASSYQIEGAVWRDGGGRSVWDMLGRQPGRISEGHTGEVACDHYHRFQEDADRSDEGAVHDQNRIRFIYQYLEHCGRAIADGVECPANLHWSALDNLEWAEGYSRRFGLVRVDYDTQQRTFKDSAYWYRDLIRSGELPPADHARQPAWATG